MSEIVIYEGAGGIVEVRLVGETVWLNQTQLAALFGRERSVVTKHLGNVFKEGELDEDSNVQNLHVAGSDKRVKFYNLDVVIRSVTGSNPWREPAFANGRPASSKNTWFAVTPSIASASS